MSSQRYQELLGRLLEGELSDADSEELAAELKERTDMQRDLRSHLVLWELWSQQQRPERSSEAFLNAWKTRLRAEAEDAEEFTEAVRSRIGALHPRPGFLATVVRFLVGGIRQPKLMAWTASVIIVISTSIFWLAGTRSAQAVTVLKGDAVCTACVLNETQDHAPAMRVAVGPSTNIYYLDRSPSVAPLQGYFCNGPTAATVEGKPRTEEGRPLFQVVTITIPEANQPTDESTNKVRTTLPN